MRVQMVDHCDMFLQQVDLFVIRVMEQPRTRTGPISVSLAGFLIAQITPYQNMSISGPHGIIGGRKTMSGHVGHWLSRIVSDTTKYENYPYKREIRSFAVHQCYYFLPRLMFIYRTSLTQDPGEK